MALIAVDKLTGMVTSYAILHHRRILLMLLMTVSAFVHFVTMLGWLRKIVGIKHAPLIIHQSLAVCRPFCQVSISPMTSKAELLRVSACLDKFGFTRLHILVAFRECLRIMADSTFTDPQLRMNAGMHGAVGQRLGLLFMANSTIHGSDIQ